MINVTILIIPTDDKIQTITILAGIMYVDYSAMMICILFNNSIFVRVNLIALFVIVSVKHLYCSHDIDNRTV